MENDIFSIPSLITNSGVPFVLGMAVGYFTKKMFKTALFLGGGIIVILFIGEDKWAIVNMDSSISYATSIATKIANSSINFLMEHLSHFTGVNGVSAVGGFFVGFKIG